MSGIDGRYEIKKGDTLWGVAKQQLKATGNKKPTNAQIIAAMNKIAQANGCEDYNACAKKYFYKVGSELNVQGLFVEKTDDSTFVDFNDGATGKKEVSKEGLTLGKMISELSPEDLKKMKEEFTTTNLQELSDEDLKKIIATIQEKFEPVELTKSDGEAGGLPSGWEKIHKKLHKKLLEQATTMAVGEEGGKAEDTATTMAVGEEGGGKSQDTATTMAVGEEGGKAEDTATTMAVGEEGGKANIKVVISDEKIKKILEELKNKNQGNSLSIHKLTKEELKEILDAIKKRLNDITTKAVGEEGGSTSVTYALGENGSNLGATTKAIGEEGGSTIVTYALGENGSNLGATTKAIGEEGGGMTTMALGEEGGTVTYALGENGDSPDLKNIKDKIKDGLTSMALGEEGGTVTYALGENGDGIKF